MREPFARNDGNSDCYSLHSSAFTWGLLSLLLPPTFPLSLSLSLSLSLFIYFSPFSLSPRFLSIATTRRPVVHSHIALSVFASVPFHFLFLSFE